MSASPAMGPRSKKLPHFGDFVRASPYSSRIDKMTNAGGIAMLLAVAAGYAMWQWQGWLGILATLFVIFPVFISIAEKIEKKTRKIDPFEATRVEELNQVMKRLRGYLDSGKLHRYLEPVAAALLEESSKNWKRVTDALAGPAWSQSNLPAHYVNIREQSKKAADRGIEDVVLLLKSSIRSQPKTEDWQVAFSKFLSEIVGVNLDRSEDDATFPVEYEPARDIATKLSKLADEIESASRKLLKEDFVKEQFASSSSLDAVLGELRAIDVAEEELHQNLRA